MKDYVIFPGIHLVRGELECIPRKLGFSIMAPSLSLFLHINIIHISKVFSESLSYLSLTTDFCKTSYIIIDNIITEYIY